MYILIQIFRYIPEIAGRYTIDITYGGEDIPFSPFPVRALQTGDASKCHAKGSGLGPSITVEAEAMVNVDCSEAGPGRLTAHVQGPHGEDVEADVFENSDTSYDVFYTAMEEGKYIEINACAYITV